MDLKKLRKDNKKNQSEIAKVLGVTQTAYSHYETGRNKPDIDTLIKLANYYQVTLDSLVERETPFLLDKSTLTSKQREIIELATELTDEECRYAIAYIQGIKKGIEERNQKFYNGGNRE